MQRIKESMVAAGNGTLSAPDYKAIAGEMRSALKDLASVANRQDANGNYMLSGTNESQPPFANVPETSPVTTPSTYYQFQGSTTNRAVQVANNRDIDQGITAADLFTDGAAAPNTKNYFASVQNIIDALDTGNVATVQTALSTEAPNVDNLYNTYLTGLTKLGGRMQELDTVEVLNTSNSTQQQQVAGDAVGLDFTKAITNITQAQVALEAAQRTFAQSSKLSLFNFIS